MRKNELLNTQPTGKQQESSSFANDLFSSFKTMINDLTNHSESTHHHQTTSNKSDSSSLNNTCHNGHRKEQTTTTIGNSTRDSKKLFPKSTDCLENELAKQVDKVKKVLDHPKVSLSQLESGNEALDDVICLLSEQLKMVSELKRSNHQKVVEKLKMIQHGKSNTELNIKQASDICAQSTVVNNNEVSINTNCDITTTTSELLLSVPPITKDEKIKPVDPWDDIFNNNTTFNLEHDPTTTTTCSEIDPRCDKISGPEIVDELPNDLLIHIGTFLFATDLLNFGQCNAKLLKLFFNQTIPRIRNMYEMKNRQMMISDIMTSTFLTSNEHVREYQKDDDETFSQVQQFIWKPLVCFFFPRLNRALNINNWMHTLRRRVSHVRIHEPHKLPLPINQTTTEPSSSFDSVNIGLPTIENCEWIYKCPINFDQLPTMSDVARHCHVCDKDVYVSKTEQEFVEHSMLGRCVTFRPFNPQLFQFLYHPPSAGIPVVFTLNNNYPMF